MTAPDELTPWTPGVIARAVEAHHWPPPTYWIRDMLEGIATAWTADLENLCIVRKTVKAQRDVVISQETRIEELEKDREEWGAATRYLQGHYPEDVFPPNSNTPDAKAGTFARRLLGWLLDPVERTRLAALRSEEET